MASARQIIKDIITVYVCYRLLGVWLFDKVFTFSLGMMVVFVMAFAIWFLLEMGGIIPKL